MITDYLSRLDAGPVERYMTNQLAAQLELDHARPTFGIGETLLMADCVGRPTAGADWSAFLCEFLQSKAVMLYPAT